MFTRLCPKIEIMAFYENTRRGSIFVVVKRHYPKNRKREREREVPVPLQNKNSAGVLRRGHVPGLDGNIPRGAVYAGSTTNVHERNPLPMCACMHMTIRYEKQDAANETPDRGDITIR